MITVRKANDRFHTNIEWLDSWHTFSFGEHYDPQHLGFRSLRVINDDRVAAGRGFGTHPHRDMEIVSYVLEGELQHRDSLGTGSVIRPGDVQRMSAGTGVLHSEYNPSPSSPTHFLQIWILPDRRGLPPSYEQRTFDRAQKLNQLRLVAAPDARDGAVTIHQDVELRAGLLESGARVEHLLRPGRHAYVHVAQGAVRVGDHGLVSGDGAALSDEAKVEIVATQPSEVLVFDLA